MLSSVNLPRIDVAVTLSGQTPQDSCPCLKYTATSPRYAYCSKIKTTVETSIGDNKNFLDKNTLVGKCLYQENFELCLVFQRLQETNNMYLKVPDVIKIQSKKI